MVLTNGENLVMNTNSQQMQDSDFGRDETKESPDKIASSSSEPPSISVDELFSKYSESRDIGQQNSPPKSKSRNGSTPDVDTHTVRDALKIWLIATGSMALLAAGFLSYFAVSTGTVIPAYAAGFLFGMIGMGLGVVLIQDSSIPQWVTDT